MKEGSTEINLPEIVLPAITLKVCNGCDYLRYDRDGGFQSSDWYCGKNWDNICDTSEEVRGYVITPDFCPFK